MIYSCICWIIKCFIFRNLWQAKERWTKNTCMHIKFNIRYRSYQNERKTNLFLLNFELWTPNWNTGTATVTWWRDRSQMSFYGMTIMQCFVKRATPKVIREGWHSKGVKWKRTIQDSGILGGSSCELVKKSQNFRRILMPSFSRPSSPKKRTLTTQT